MIYLLNSAVLSAPGTYTYEILSREEISRLLRENEWESRIGYPATAQHIESLCGRRPALSRELSVLAPGDEALVVRLKYRVSDPARKVDWQPSEDDWEYGRIVRTA